MAARAVPKGTGQPGRYKVEFENKVKGKLKDNVTGSRPAEAGRALQIQFLTFGDKVDDPVSMYLADIYTVTASLAGICGLSVPCGKSQEGLPISLQILGKHFDEAMTLRVAQTVETLQK